MKTAVNEIIEHFQRVDAERFEPYPNTFRHPATGKEMENAVMVPVSMLRQLVADHTTNLGQLEIAHALLAWSPSIAMGYEVPAAAQTMNAAANLLNQQAQQLEEARQVMHHYVYTGAYEGRPTDSSMQERGRTLIKQLKASK